jgi:outer membrane protein
MNKTLIALLAAGFLYLPGASALDLHGVFEMAKEHDPKVRQVRDQLSSARESKPQAQALLLPTLSVSGDYQLTDQNIRKSFAFKGWDQYNQRDLGLSVSQPLYHRDYWIRLAQADDTVAQAEAQVAVAEIDLMVRTATAYFNVLAAADSLRTATAEKEANARQLEQAQQRFNVGLIPITDVHESQAGYDGAAANEIAAQNDLSNAWEALREIVGAIRQPIAKLGEALPLMPPEPNDVEQWARTALRQNYGILAAEKAAQLAQKGIDVQHSGHYPTLDLVGSYGVSDSTSVIGTSADTAVIGLQLRVPLYQGGAVSSRERQARHDFEAAQDALDQQRRAVNRQVRDAFRGVISTISRVKALKSTVVSFESALESTQAGLEVGTRTMVDVLTVTRSLYQAERDYSRARYDYIINGLLLHQAASTLTPELLEKANGWLVQDQTIAPPG